MDWNAAKKKQMKPPVVPAKRANTICPNNDEGEVNPYALLNCNFESEFYDRDICMWNAAPASPKHSSADLGSEDNPTLSNFTYDKHAVRRHNNN